MGKIGDEILNRLKNNNVAIAKEWVYAPKVEGEKQLLRFAVELEAYGRAENMPVLEGKRMTMMLAPIKKK